MPTVRQLLHDLTERPAPHEIPGIAIRTFQGDDDIHPWLNLRERAFARQPLGVRAWTQAGFDAEFRQKWWWRPEHLWFADFVAEVGELPQPIGTIAMAMRGENWESAKPAVHWLAVLPAWRRRGVGKLLMATLEAAAWDRGYRQVWLETHQAWANASAFYEAIGYRPA